MADLCSAADVMAYLELEPTDSTAQTLLPGMVSAASAQIQQYVGSCVVTTVVTNEVHSGDGTRSLLLDYFPVQSIQKLVIDGTEIAAVTTTSEGYVLEDDRLWLSGPTGPGDFTYWYTSAPSTSRLTGLRFTCGSGNVVVSYTAGFATVPADLKQVAIEKAAAFYLGRKRLGVMTETLGTGATVTYQTLTLNPNHKAILDQYRKYRI